MKMSSRMTSRERILTTINHKEPDRVPIDLGSTISTSMVKEAYDELRRYLRLTPSSGQLICPMQRVSKIEDDIFNEFGFDALGVWPGSPEDLVYYSENEYKDAWGVTRTKPQSSFYFDQRDFPLAGQISKKDIINYKYPNPNHPNITANLKKQIDDIRKNTNCAIVLNLPSCFVHISQYLRGFEDWFVDCAINVPLIELLFDSVLEINMIIAENALSVVGKEVDVIRFSDDLGTQNSLQVSPDFFRRSIKPRFKKYVDLIHKMKSPEAKVKIHCCGSIEPILKDFIEIGIEIINPVQISAKGMDPESLKKQYGDKLSFWGGIDTQHVLAKGNPAEVKKEVERIINILGPNGGFVLASVHNIQPDVLPENVETMFTHAKTYSQEFYNRRKKEKEKNR